MCLYVGSDLFSMAAAADTKQPAAAAAAGDDEKKKAADAKWAAALADAAAGGNGTSSIEPSANLHGVWTLDVSKSDDAEVSGGRGWECVLSLLFAVSRY